MELGVGYQLVMFKREELDIVGLYGAKKELDIGLCMEQKRGVGYSWLCMDRSWI